MKLFLKISYLETFYEDFLELDSFPISIGRDPANKIKLMGHEISKNHAEIFERDGVLFLRDNTSHTGVWFESKRIQEIEIKEGAQVRMGHALLSFSFIHFPLEQTISHATEEHPHTHEPLTKRIEAAFSTKLLWALIAVLGLLSFYTEPDFYRRSDLIKKLTYSVSMSTFLLPFLIALFIVILRKVNRGDYSWLRSLCLSYILVIGMKLFALLTSSFCWFSSFNFIWGSSVAGIFMMAVFFYWWFMAVAKDARFKQRIVKSFGLSLVVYALVMGAQLLTTGYQSEFEIESCDSLTGWHWGTGSDLASIDQFLKESAKELSSED